MPCQFFGCPRSPFLGKRTSLAFSHHLTLSILHYRLYSAINSIAVVTGLTISLAAKAFSHKEGIRASTYPLHAQVSVLHTPSMELTWRHSSVMDW